jgi:putative spermidine/putrescine transport system permease protein
MFKPSADLVTLIAFKLPAAIFVSGLLAIPVFGILILSVTEPTLGLGNYYLLVSNPALQRVFITTLRISLVTTLIATIVGYLIAYKMHKASPAQARLIVFCLTVPLWTSILVRAFAWVALLQSNGLINSALLALGLIETPLPMVRNEIGVIVAMVHVMIPFAVLPIYSTMNAIDPRIIQAGQSLGAKPWSNFWKVFFPLTLPGVGAGMILVFITSAGFYVTPIILGGGKVVMIAEYISVQVTETLRWGLGAMLATVLLALVLLFVTVFSKLTLLKQEAA